MIPILNRRHDCCTSESDFSMWKIESFFVSVLMNMALQLLDASHWLPFKEELHTVTNPCPMK